MYKKNDVENGAKYTGEEEIANSITHGIGLALAITALVLLTIKATSRSDLSTVSYVIYGASLVVLYLFSTLYHSLPICAKKVFGIFDHNSIFILIAGTYTPFCLSILKGALGWSIFGIVWGIAILGIVLYSVFGSKIKIVSLFAYIITGWLIVIAFKEIKANLSSLSFNLLVVGGIAYTVGCIFYALKKIKWMHTIWHLFVIAGSVLHFFAIYLY